MAIDARIKAVTQDGSNLILELEPRQGGGLAGQDRLTIEGFTHVPAPGQEIWGGADTCHIEPSHGVTETMHYRRVMYTRLREKS